MQPQGQPPMLGQNQHNGGNGFSIGGKKYVARDLYTYQEDFSLLANGTTATAQINIQADADFVWQKSTYYADIAAAAFLAETRPIPNATIIITDTGSGRQLVEAAVPIPSMFGTGELPFVLPVPRLFFARSTINLEVANFDAAATYTIRLSFIGYKAYPEGF